jgi:hypothetical protein
MLQKLVAENIIILSNEEFKQNSTEESHVLKADSCSHDNQT